MTPEQKLEHLRNWMACWISARVSSIQVINNVFYLFENYGMIPTKGHILDVIPFDEYLKLVSCPTV